MKRILVIASAAVLVVSTALFACGKSDGDKSGRGKKGTKVSKMAVSGTLQLSANLTDSATRVSHVMAVSPLGGERVIAALGSDNSFSLSVDKTKPWIIAFLDDSKIGADMVVARFKSDALDTLTPGESPQKSIALGTVTPPAASATDKAASVSLGFADLATKLGLSTAGAEFAGQVDDVCLRYVNPDIDGNGKIDLLETKEDGIDRRFNLEFHNRFDPKNASGQNVVLADYKNSFPSYTSISHSSSGIMLYVPKAYHTTQPTTFEHRFEEAVSIENSEVAAGTWHPTTFDPSYPSGSDTWNIHIETKQPPAGKYEIKMASGTTFTFTDVKISDLSTPTGFLVPLVKINVDTATDVIQSVDWKWIKKTTAGFADATTEEVKMVVTGSGAYLGMTFTDGNTLGFTIAKEATGNVVARESGKRWSDINASNSLGLSYDDKLGMRMFVNMYAQ